MPFKTPSFWYNTCSTNIVQRILWPLSLLYRAGYEIHQATGKQEKFSLPVICVGNITAGGSGKTPVALALMALIKRNAFASNPFFVTRGYGSQISSPTLFNSGHNNLLAGDEAIVLADAAPTIVSPDRSKGILLAANRLADMVVMDDGLQNPHIHKTISFLVIDGSMGFGNGLLLPAGPLREPVERGLSRADAFILIGTDEHNIQNLIPQNKPVFSASMHATAPPAPGRYIAFAGIGYPQKFFSFLKKFSGVEISETVSYPDHHAYSASDIQSLRDKAGHLGARLITTRKDAVKIADLSDIDVLDIIIQWDNEPALCSFLKEKTGTI